MVKANLEDVAKAVAKIKEAGAVDASNLKLAGNHTPVANPGGYQGGATMFRSSTPARAGPCSAPRST